MSLPKFTQPSSPSAFIYARAANTHLDVASDPPPRRNAVPSPGLLRHLEAFSPQAVPQRQTGTDTAFFFSTNGHKASVRHDARRPYLEVEEHTESHMESSWGRFGYDNDISLLDDDPDDTVRVHTVSSCTPVSNRTPEAVNLVRLPIAEEIHRICLDATQEFLVEFKRNIELRRPLLSRQHREAPSGSNSGSSNLNGAPVRDEASERLYHESDVSNSLKSNVSTICSIIWEESQALKMLRPTSEVEGVTDMRALIDASEKVLEGLAWLEDGTGEAAREMVEAGMAFCRCLESQIGEDAVFDIGRLYLG